ncbi:MAG: hypothetical protein U0T83_04450 [Bacteriovoracaceae bacterium]
MFSKIFLAPVVIMVLIVMNANANCLKINGYFRERELISGHETEAIREIKSDCNYIDYKLDDLDLHLIPGKVQRVFHGNSAYSEFRMVNFYSEGIVIQQIFFQKEIAKYKFEMRFFKKDSGQFYVIRTRLDFPDKISSAVTELNPVHI